MIIIIVYTGVPLRRKWSQPRRSLDWSSSTSWDRLSFSAGNISCSFYGDDNLCGYTRRTESTLATWTHLPASRMRDAIKDLNGRALYDLVPVMIIIYTIILLTVSVSLSLSLSLSLCVAYLGSLQTEFWADRFAKCLKMSHSTYSTYY